MRTRYSSRDFSTSIVVAAVAVFLSGCAHLLNPYVVPEHLKPASSWGKTRTQYSSDLAGARQEAEAYIAELFEAAADHSELRGGTALATVPMAAIAAYKGVNSDGNGTKKIISKLTIGAAGLFGLSEYFYSPPRQQVYFQGAITTSCLVRTTDPYVISEDDLGEFRDTLEALHARIAQTRGLVQQVEDAYGASDRATQQLRRPIPSYVSAAKKSLVEAQRTYDAGFGLLADYGDAGSSLRQALTTLSAKVNLEVKNTEPDIAGIKAIGVAVAAAAKPPATTGATSTPGAQPELGGPKSGDINMLEAIPTDDLGARVARLHESLGAMVDLTSAVAVRVDKVGAQVKKVGSASDCTLAPAPTFMIQGATKRVLEIPSTNYVVVTGATGRLNAYLDGTYAADKVLATPKMDANFFGVLVEVKEGAAAGAVKLVVQDSSSAPAKSVDLELTAKAPASGGTSTTEKGATDKPKNPPTTTKKSVATISASTDEVTNPEEVKLIQRVVGANVDGVAGDETHEKVKAYQEQKGLPPADGRLTRALLDKIRPPANPASVTSGR